MNSQFLTQCFKRTRHSLDIPPLKPTRSNPMGKAVQQPPLLLLGLQRQEKYPARFEITKRILEEHLLNAVFF